MANSYYSISTSSPLADIKTALQNKYGSSNVTVHYESASYLIISCAAISDKVIKFYLYTTARILTYYGDAWTSGSTITNEVQFSGYTNGGAATEIHLVLGTNFFFMCSLLSTVLSIVTVIAKMSNNDYVCMSFIGGGSSYSGTSRAKNTTDGADITICTFDRKFSSSTGKLYMQNTIIIKANGAAETNTDGILAHIPDLYNVSHSLSSSTLLKGSNYLMSPTGLYLVDGLAYVRTCLFAAF